MNKTDNLLARADADAEGLLGLVRMAIALTLAIAMVLAVTSSPRPESNFLQAQLWAAAAIISSYFIVGLTTFLVVRKGRYKPWMAWVSAALDVTLIAANVWASLNNTGASTLFALSFPSALMVPLVLTFGALRYRPSIQIAMTALMGVSITAIVFCGPLDTDISVATLSYMTITYGVPPNVMRIVMVMATGGVIALAAWRGRRLLQRVATEAEQRVNLTRFLPKGVAAHMTDESVRHLRQGRTAQLAIMFVDIREFTHLAEHMSPPQVSRLLGAYRSIILDTVEEHSGVVDKFIGDGALVLFGIAKSSGTDRSSKDAAATQAVRAATGLLAKIDRWNDQREAEANPRIEIGIGLHYGSVVVGAIGDDRRLEFTVIGDEVNVASRVEQATKVLHSRLLATEAVMHAAAAPTDQWRDLGNVELRGRDMPVRLWSYGSLISEVSAVDE